MTLYFPNFLHLIFKTLPLVPTTGKNFLNSILKQIFKRGPIMVKVPLGSLNSPKDFALLFQIELIGCLFNTWVHIQNMNKTFLSLLHLFLQFVQRFKEMGFYENRKFMAKLHTWTMFRTNFQKNIDICLHSIELWKIFLWWEENGVTLNQFVHFLFVGCYLMIYLWFFHVFYLQSIFIWCFCRRIWIVAVEKRPNVLTCINDVLSERILIQIFVLLNILI